MSFFKDANGREWEISLNLGLKAKMRSRVGVNFNDALKRPEFLDEIVGDPFIFFSVLCVAVESQLKERKLSEEEFGEALSDEDVVSDAARAFVEATIESFPHGQRRALRTAFDRLWSATKAKANAMEKKLIDEIEKTDFDALADKLLQTSTSLSSADTVGDSSGSTGNSTHSEN